MKWVLVLQVSCKRRHNKKGKTKNTTLLKQFQNPIAKSIPLTHKPWLGTGTSV